MTVGTLSRKQRWITTAIEIHGNKFDYTNVDYVNSYTKVRIKCNLCGLVFDQTPNSHTSRHHACGCPRCRYTNRTQSKPYTTLTTDEFVSKAINVHGHRYRYDNVVYVNSRTPVIIECPEHGKFEQRPNNHLRGAGCMECEYIRKSARNKSRALSLKEFVLRAQVIYGTTYDYTNSTYVASNKPITIQCHAHGAFTVGRAEKHLSGQACPSCSNTGSLPEQLISRILDTHNIQYLREYVFDDCVSPITNRKLRFDFYIPARHLLIEYDGEQHTKQSPLFHKNGRYDKQKLHDAVKTQYAREHNTTLVRIPHCPALNNLWNIIEEIIFG